MARMMATMSEISDRISKAREVRGLSARGLSLAAGLSDGVVAQIERGDIKSPRGDALVSLAKALDVDVGWLLTGEGRGPADTQPAA